MGSETQTTPYGQFNTALTCRTVEDITVKDGGVQTGPFGSQLHKKDYVSDGTPIITVEHLGENKILHTNLPRVSDTDKSRLKKYMLQEGDIVFSRVGSVDLRAYVHKAEDGWLFSGRCLRVRADRKIVDPRFLSFFFGMPSFREHIRRIAVGATMPSLNTKLLSDVLIYLPPLPEQKAIAHILGSLDDKIELNRKMNETVEAMAKAIFKSWFVDFDPVKAKAEGRKPEGMDAETAKLFPDSFVDSELGKIPKGWNVGKLGDVADVRSGKRPPSRSNEKILGMSIPILGANGLMAYTSAPLYDSNYLLTGRVGTHGKVFRITYPSFPSDNALILFPKNTFDYDMIYFCMKMLDYTSLNRGSTQPLITQSDISSQRVVLAQDELRKTYSNHATALFAEMDGNIIENNALANIRNTLLPKLLSGELRIKDAEKSLGNMA